MKKSKFTESQIINILKEAEAGISLEELSRQHGFSKATFYKWKARFGGMDVSALKRLKELEEENRRLKQMYADSIIQAVTKCWESARSEHALDYRRQQGLSVERPQLAVLVQQLVASDVSAVVFSANPITGDRDEVMINASWGLGESIVGGTVTPNTFIVRKSDLAVIQRVIADKQRMTVSAPGGTHEVDVPRFLRNTTSLNDEQVIEMAKLALILEVTIEYPVNVECAYAGGELYLLQCRPITTLK